MHGNWKFFLKDTIRMMVDFSTTPQNQGFAPPPLQKPCASDAVRIPLPGPGDWADAVADISVREAIASRTSHRAFSPASLSLEELAFLLWATQGLRKPPTAMNAYRTVPSAGCRHSLETYLAVFRIAGLESGLYRYLPLDHALVLEGTRDDLPDAVRVAALGQGFVARSAVTFLWSTIPERMAWRYGEASAKVIALDAGHVCQNLYLACAAIGAGTCAVAAYDQEAADALLGLDGDSELTLYMAPVGKIGEVPTTPASTSGRLA